MIIKLWYSPYEHNHEGQNKSSQTMTETQERT